MLKYAFLAGAMTLAVPAFAQDAPARDMTPQTMQPAPTTTDQTAPAQPTQAVPQASAPADSVAAQDSAMAPAHSSAATQPASATQVADVVSKEFASYDKNGDGVLSAKEFDGWMVALKTASDPATKPNAPATKTWLSQALAQADTDKNKKVSQAELTGFLSQQG